MHSSFGQISRTHLFFLQNDQKEGMTAFVEKRKAKFTNS